MGAGIEIFRVLVIVVGRACDRSNARKTHTEVVEEKYTTHKLEVGLSKQQIISNQQIRWHHEQDKAEQESSGCTQLDKFMFIVLFVVVVGLFVFGICLHK